MNRYTEDFNFPEVAILDTSMAAASSISFPHPSSSELERKRWFLIGEHGLPPREALAFCPLPPLALLLVCAHTHCHPPHMYTCTHTYADAVVDLEKSQRRD